MIVNQITDAQLTKAAAMVRASILSALPRSEDCDQTFSREFEQKMEVMQRRAEQKNRHRRITHRVAAAIAAILVGFSLLCALNTEVRAAVKAWVKEIWDSIVVYSFEGNIRDTLPQYELTYVPEGYRIISDNTLTYSRSRLYKQGENSKAVFTFTYSAIQEDSQLFADYSDLPYEVREVFVCGCRGELYISSDKTKESHTLMWVDEEAGVYFVIASFLEPEEMLHIAESVILVK